MGGRREHICSRCVRSGWRMVGVENENGGTELAEEMEPSKEVENEPGIRSRESIKKERGIRRSQEVKVVKD